MGRPRRRCVRSSAISASRLWTPARRVSVAVVAKSPPPRHREPGRLRRRAAASVIRWRQAVVVVERRFRTPRPRSARNTGRAATRIRTVTARSSAAVRAGAAVRLQQRCVRSSAISASRRSMGVRRVSVVVAQSAQPRYPEPGLPRSRAASSAVGARGGGGGQTAATVCTQFGHQCQSAVDACPTRLCDQQAVGTWPTPMTRCFIC